MVAHAPSAVDAANSLQEPEFVSRHVAEALKHLDLPDSVEVAFHKSNTMSNASIDACVNMVHATSGDAYRQSSIGWSHKDKAKEMRDPKMNFILLSVKPAPQSFDGSTLAGFASFMLDEEDGVQISYLYEIHLQSDWRGKSIGAQLMRAVESITQSAGMQQVMLTVFTSNKAAQAFYEKLGYTWHDEEPVKPQKKLRGRLVEPRPPSYFILSKHVG